jgi:hypothetical protein
MSGCEGGGHLLARTHCCTQLCRAQAVSPSAAGAPASADRCARAGCAALCALVACAHWCSCFRALCLGFGPGLVVQPTRCLCLCARGAAAGGGVFPPAGLPLRPGHQQVRVVGQHGAHHAQPGEGGGGGCHQAGPAWVPVPERIMCSQVRGGAVCQDEGPAWVPTGCVDSSTLPCHPMPTCIPPSRAAAGHGRCPGDGVHARPQDPGDQPAARHPRWHQGGLLPLPLPGLVRDGRNKSFVGAMPPSPLPPVPPCDPSSQSRIGLLASAKRGLLNLSNMPLRSLPPSPPHFA